MTLPLSPSPAAFLQNHLLEMDAKKALAPTWETVRYMISCIQYGGRITDDFDQLLMDTFAEKYFHQGVLQVSLLSIESACVRRMQLS